MTEAIARIIQHDPGVLFDRWHFAGTEISVAEVLLDYRSQPDRSPDGYTFLDLSPEEIQAALSFPFPAVRRVTVSSALLVITIECECGEDTHTTITAEWDTEVACVCGRIWLVKLSVSPKKPGTHRGSS